MDKNTPEEMIPVAEFGKLKGISSEKVIDMIRDGFYTGRKVGDEWFIDESELHSNDKKHTSNDGTTNSKTLIVFGAILIAAGFLIYANGEQLGIFMLGGKDQLMRDAMHFSMLDEGYRNKVSSVGNFIQGLYSVSIAVGFIMLVLGLVKSKK